MVIDGFEALITKP